MDTNDFAPLLHGAGLRATEGRLALLALLAKERKPLSVRALEERMRGTLNQVTLYRALEALERADIVSRSYLAHDHAHYELVAGRPHHHHAICRGCGLVEDIIAPHNTSPEREARGAAKRFARIDAHATEFFGMCRSCA